ncbi:MAG: hypothetical protein KGY80_13780, partial [Candidatus Thorarchaeota archaeon]|nr:hypothetical protein [Candidatus Thorarchaeota archaeon]
NFGFICLIPCGRKVIHKELRKGHQLLLSQDISYKKARNAEDGDTAFLRFRSNLGNSRCSTSHTFGPLTSNGSGGELNTSPDLVRILGSVGQL